MEVIKYLLPPLEDGLSAHKCWNEPAPGQFLFSTTSIEGKENDVVCLQHILHKLGKEWQFKEDQSPYFLLESLQSTKIQVAVAKMPKSWWVLDFSHQARLCAFDLQCVQLIWTIGIAPLEESYISQAPFWIVITLLFSSHWSALNKLLQVRNIKKIGDCFHKGTLGSYINITLSHYIHSRTITKTYCTMKASFK